MIKKYLLSAFLILSSIIFQLVIPSSVSQAAEYVPFRIGVESSTILIEDKSDLENNQKAVFRISGGSPGYLVAELVDLYIDSDGVKRIAPLGATPYSAQDLVTIINPRTSYFAGLEETSLAVEFKFSEDTNLNAPIVGGIRLTLIPFAEFSNSANSGITLQVSGINVFSYLPPGYSITAPFDVSTDLDLSALRLFLTTNEPLFYSLLPNFQSLFHSKNLGFSYSLMNSGEIFQSVETVVSLNKRNFLGSNNEVLVFQDRFINNLLMPNESLNKQMPLTLKTLDQTRNISAIDSFGFYSLTITTTGRLSGEIISTTALNKKFLVLPWKIFVYLFLFIAIRAFIKSRRVKRDVSESVTQEIPIVELDPEIERMLEAIKPVRARKVAKKKAPVKKKQVAKVAKKPVKKIAKKKVAKKAVKKKVKAKS